MSGKDLYSAKALAKLLGLTERRVQQLTKEGTLPAVSSAGGYGYELAPAVQAYIAYIKAGERGRGNAQREQQLKQQKMEAEIALKEAQNEAQRMKTDIAAGQYILAQDIQQDYARFFVAFKKFALALPGRLIWSMGALADMEQARRAEKELQGEVERQLRAFVAAGVQEAGR